ncbi:MAG: hypothetical protein JXR67_06015 [Bacteroidales bacterium]|nr:hypothetical protein [Bacteroidales bacterium]
MKKFLITSILAAIVAIGTAAKAQDYPDEYLGLPGDNFNLYAVMNLFQQSETLEGFERSLNDENSRINNLDLNNDNYIDYVKVIDYVKGNVHTIVLQAVLDRDDSQDVAVFTVEKFRDGAVQIQLIGDEALYGRNYIIEPYLAETPNPGYTGRAKKQNVQTVRTTYVAIDAWPVVRYIYLPNYTIWRSSWYWGYYPSYWRPWSPYYWHYYYGYHYHWYPTYYAHYRVYHSPRWSGWNDFYYRDKRMYSRNVTVNINEGKYKTTYSRPESRREGEALYAKVHPDRASSMTQQGTTTTRRSSSQAAPQQNQNAGSATSTSRRAGSTATETTRSSTQTGQTTGNTRRSTSGSSEGQSTSTSRRSSGTSVSKPATSSQAGPRVESTRTSRQQTSAPAATSRRSNETKVAKETVVKQRSSSAAKAREDKKAETTSSRRK